MNKQEEEGAQPMNSRAVTPWFLSGLPLFWLLTVRGLMDGVIGYVTNPALHPPTTASSHLELQLPATPRNPHNAVAHPPGCLVGVGPDTGLSTGPRVANSSPPRAPHPHADALARRPEHHGKPALLFHRRKLVAHILLLLAQPARKHYHPVRPAADSMDRRAHGQVPPDTAAWSGRAAPNHRQDRIREEPQGERDRDPEPERNHRGQRYAGAGRRVVHQGV
jgi:hypothetical protein